MKTAVMTLIVDGEYETRTLERRVFKRAPAER